MRAVPPEPKIKPELRFSFRFSSFFASTSPAQKMNDVVVIFMTGVLVHLLVRIDLRPRNDSGPRLGPGFWILNREFVIESVSIDAAEALRDAKGFRIGILEDHPIVGPEIRRFDDQRIPFPMTARVAQPLPKVFSNMRSSVERDRTGTVDHLGRNDDISWALENLKI